MDRRVDSRTAVSRNADGSRNFDNLIVWQGYPLAESTWYVVYLGTLMLTKATGNRMPTSDLISTRCSRPTIPSARLKVSIPNRGSCSSKKRPLLLTKMGRRSRDDLGLALRFHLAMSFSTNVRPLFLLVLDVLLSS